MKAYKLGAASIIGIIAFIGLSCSSPFRSSQASGKVATVGGSALVLTVNALLPSGTGASYRTIMPNNLSSLVKAYKARIHNQADGGSAANDKVVDLAASVTTISLAAATYDVTVQGFSAATDGNLIASGTATGVAVGAGSAASVTVTLSPVMSGGTGGVDLTLYFPSGLADSVAASFGGTAIDGAAIQVDSSDSTRSYVRYQATPAAGSYLLIVKLSKGGTVRATYMNSIWVCANLTYVGDYSLAASRFGTEPEAPADLELAPELPTQTGTSSPGILVSWSDVAATEEAYEVFKSSDGSSFSQVGGDLAAGTTSYLDTGLASGTTYYYYVKAKNRFGESAACATASVQAYASSPAAAFVTAGKAALEAKDFDLAYAKFTQAAALDPANTEALVYGAAISIAACAVDSSAVDLMKNRLGLVDYPSSMNTLFSGSILSQHWYRSKEGFVAVASPVSTYSYYIRGDFTPGSEYWTNYYNEYGESRWSWGRFTPNPSGANYSHYYWDVGSGMQRWVYPADFPGMTMYDRVKMVDASSTAVVLPRFTIPSWASSLIGKEYAGETAEYPVGDNVGIYFLLNVLDRNPNGLNGIVDSLLGGAFGARYQRALALIDALPDDAEVTVPDSLPTAFGAPAPTTSLVISKRELSLLATALQASRSFVQLLASYNLDYPLSNFRVPFWEDDSAEGGIPSWADTILKTAPNPIAVGFLGDRSQTMRDQARATMLDSLARAERTMELIEGLTSAEAIAMTGGYAGSPTQADIDEITLKMADGIAAVEKVRLAIANDTALDADISAFGNGDILNFFPASVSSDYTIVVRPARLYTTDLLNPAKFLASSKDPNGASIGVKLFGLTPYGRTYLDSEAAACQFAYETIQLGVNYTRITELFTPAAFMDTPPIDSDGYFYISIIDIDGKRIPKPIWRVLNWIRGYNS